MATMKDVANRAGVSLSTVSYVLSGSRPISGPTRTLILQAMEDLNFQPNAVARALASKRTRVIALLLSPQERGLGLSELDFVKSASETALALDHHLVLLTEGMDSETHLTYLKRQGLVDGVILMEVHLKDPRVPLLQSLDLPFSLLGQPDPALNLTFVDIDFDTSLRLVLESLAAQGHRRVAFVNQSRETYLSGYGPSVRAQVAAEHWSGKLGIELTKTFSHPTPKDGWETCQTLFSGPRNPTALVVMNDRALPGLLQALASLNLRIPEDVSIVSAVTSASSAEMMVPALTSADAPSRELARLAVTNLVKSIENPEEVMESILIPCSLTSRASTGPVAPT